MYNIYVYIDFGICLTGFALVALPAISVLGGLLLTC